MKTTAIEHPLLLAVLLSTLTPHPAIVFAQGSLTPPGAPAATMRTLTQLEPRTPISNASTITQRGSYYLTTNITVSSGDGIVIATNSVTLDLNGFTIASTGASTSGSCGIRLNGGLRNLTILNGFIQGSVTNNAGVYGGPGFQFGIYYSGVAPVNARVTGISVSGCLTDGIDLGYDDSTVAEACVVRTVGGVGITASVVKSSEAVECGGNAISCDLVFGSQGRSIGGAGISANTSAENCFGISTNNAGIAVVLAVNCCGSSNSGNGIQCTSAQNCWGYSISGQYGMGANIAQNCYGYSGSGSYGLLANTAQNCGGGNGGAGVGLRANNVAIGCTGSSASGIGLSANIANSCAVATGTSSITYKYNMP